MIGWNVSLCHAKNQRNHFCLTLRSAYLGRLMAARSNKIKSYYVPKKSYSIQSDLLHFGGRLICVYIVLYILTYNFNHFWFGWKFRKFTVNLAWFQWTFSGLESWSAQKNGWWKSKNAQFRNFETIGSWVEAFVRYW